MATPARRHRKSIPLSAPKTPKDVRQLDRNEMIKYLQKYDEEASNDLDQMMRASLQKRVIQCMKQRQNSRQSPTTKQANIAQSALPNTRVSRKRKAEIPMTSQATKRMKMSTIQSLQNRLPITSLFSESTDEQKEQDLDFSTLQLNFDQIEPTKLNNSDEASHEHKTDEPQENKTMLKLLQTVRKGIPARYDIIALPHSIMNVDTNTKYLRSSKMQKLFEACYMGHELHCVVRTVDDVYGLNDYDIQQIESNVTEWVHKYGEYSSTLHPSIYINEDKKLEANNHIFQYEVLGRFNGDEMIENEFHEIYCGTFDEHRRSLHSWVFEVNIPIIETNGDAVDSEHEKWEQYDMLVDCLGKTNKAHSKLLLIEDCRADLNLEITTKDDLKKENVLFITIEINGWPGKFAIAKRNINKNEILYGHFGEGYSSLKKQVQRQQQSVEYFVSSISRLLSSRDT